MRRKCRLADTWLTQRVLLDSWNVTFSQGAECCTLNLSLSNNRSRSICLLRLNVEMTDLLRKENNRYFLCASNCERSKLLVKLQNARASYFPFNANKNTQTSRICISADVLLHECTVGSFCTSSTEHNGRFGKKKHISGEDEVSNEYSFSMRC